ncbi:MAG: hypothetical protein HYZ73_07705, partial [Elusimicrobia bacterium]|nr:hypothetical protein [Elusimicrobiota bacterium]
YGFSHLALHALADQAAQALGLEIYGGDVVITPEGRLALIDVNDWPTFAPCRGAAGRAIGTYLIEQLRLRTHHVSPISDL